MYNATESATNERSLNYDSNDFHVTSSKLVRIAAFLMHFISFQLSNIAYFINKYFQIL